MMQQYFHVGEIAIFCNGINCPELNGIEVTITEELAMREHFDGGEVLCYVTDYILSDGCILSPLPNQLRKKFDKGSWDNCLFKPKEKENI